MKGDFKMNLFNLVKSEILREGLEPSDYEGEIQKMKKEQITKGEKDVV